MRADTITNDYVESLRYVLQTKLFPSHRLIDRLYIQQHHKLLKQVDQSLFSYIQQLLIRDICLALADAAKQFKTLIALLDITEDQKNL